MHAEQLWHHVTAEEGEGPLLWCHVQPHLHAFKWCRTFEYMLQSERESRQDEKTLNSFSYLTVISSDGFANSPTPQRKMVRGCSCRAPWPKLLHLCYFKFFVVFLTDIYLRDPEIGITHGKSCNSHTSLSDYINLYNLWTWVVICEATHGILQSCTFLYLFLAFIERHIYTLLMKTVMHLTLSLWMNLHELWMHVFVVHSLLRQWTLISPSYVWKAPLTTFVLFSCSVLGCCLTVPDFRLL